jgi:hypothetical protein
MFISDKLYIFGKFVLVYADVNLFGKNVYAVKVTSKYMSADDGYHKTTRRY